MTRSEQFDGNITDIEIRALCSDCVGEVFLSSQIEESGAQNVCFYCGKQGMTFSINQMADEIETAFEHHFFQTPTEPSPFEYAMAADSEFGWERSGDPISYVVQDAAGLDEEPTDDICAVLEHRYADRHLDEVGEEAPFSSDSYFARRHVDDRDYFEQWKYFEGSLKKEARFFSRDAEEVLKSVFEELSAHRTDNGAPVIVEAGPGKGINCFFRARIFQSYERLKTALEHPDVEIGPPPPTAALAGRMNARGISVFYGALDADVAIAEIRPPVGARVILGRFDLVRPVHLLDVEALRTVNVAGSIFDGAFIRRLKRARFLERLSHRLTMPVMPDDEDFDYLVTQAVSDYLATIAETPLDGIIYPSAQDGHRNLNVVLFHKASKVALYELPKGTKIEAHLSHGSEDDPDIDYWVWETLPKEKNKSNEPKDFTSFDLIPETDLTDYDPRDVTLHLDSATIEVHHIEGVKFRTDKYSVRRHQSREGDEEF